MVSSVADTANKTNKANKAKELGMRKSLGCVMVAVGLLGMSSPGYAQDIAGDTVLQEDLEQLLDLSLEELVTVSTASKRDEKISEAPSVITVVTRKEIEQYGGLTLHDILNRVPNLQVIGSTSQPSNNISIRAGTNQHYSNRILFLINGRPIRDTWGGGFTSVFLTGFPISTIEHIEVIRGPGSVLYGTNAFSGVINVVTKDAEDQNLYEASVTYGSFSRRQFEGRINYRGEDWSLVGAGKYTRASGDSFNVTDENGVSGSFSQSTDQNSLYLEGQYKNFDLTVFRGRLDEGHFGFQARLPQSQSDYKKAFIDLGYTQPLWEGWSAKTNITYNRFRKGYWSDNDADHQDDLLIAELNVQGEIRPGLNALFGGTSEHTDGRLSGASYQTHRHSIFSQIDWKPYDWLKLVGGLQLNDSEDFKSNFSPRGGIIINPHENWGTKILYGEAFRSATAIESDVNIPSILVGDSNISPETIKTIEAQIFYESKALSGSITGYRSRIEDIIARVPNPSAGGLLSTNTGEQIFRGIELEGKYQLGGGWSLQGSAAYQDGESDNDIQDPTFFPNINAKFGFRYDAKDWSVGVFDSYFGDPEDIRGTNPAVQEVNQQPESYHLVSLNVTVDLNHALDLDPTMPDMEFTLYGENLLNEDIFFPELNRRNINSTPIETGRAIFGRIKVTF